MNILCIDVGNSTVKYGIYCEKSQSIIHRSILDTPELLQHEEAFTEVLNSLKQEGFSFEGVSFSSVVPKANKNLLSSLEKSDAKIFHLTHETYRGAPIAYPRPADIGQDRLATSIGGQTLLDFPLLIIDMGTAVTIDIVTKEHGYETGIIAPGLNFMMTYLHEKTAQLPLLNRNELKRTGCINQLTADAMRQGCTVGFTGMVDRLVEETLDEMNTRNDFKNITILCTGGSSELWLANTKQKNIEFNPNLLLLGLGEAYRRYNTS